MDASFGEYIPSPGAAKKGSLPGAPGQSPTAAATASPGTGSGSRSPALKIDYYGTSKRDVAATRAYLDKVRR